VIRFKILRANGGGTPGSAAARARGCSCPTGPNGLGAGLPVSDDTTRKGFWIEDRCEIHAHLLDE